MEKTEEGIVRNSLTSHNRYITHTNSICMEFIPSKDDEYYKFGAYILSNILFLDSKHASQSPFWLILSLLTPQLLFTDLIDGPLVRTTGLYRTNPCLSAPVPSESAGG